MQFGIHAIQQHRIRRTAGHLDPVAVVREGPHPPLGEHDVVIEFGGETLAKLDREVIERGRRGGEVVGANDGGVAARVAAADLAALDHCDVGQPVVLREVVGGCQAMAAAADHNRVVAAAPGRMAPCRLPSALAIQALAQQGQSRIASGQHPSPSRAFNAQLHGEAQ